MPLAFPIPSITFLTVSSPVKIPPLTLFYRTLPLISDRPNPTYDGSDLIGREFLDSDLGVCQVIGPSEPLFLSPQTGNLEAGSHLSPGWHPTLLYKSSDG